jgi:hypothetical protein
MAAQRSRLRISACGPPTAGSRFARAGVVVARAGRSGKSAGAGESTRRLFRAITLLEKAARAAGQSSVQDPSNHCLAGIVDRITEAYARTFCVAAGGS